MLWHKGWAGQLWGMPILSVLQQKMGWTWETLVHWAAPCILAPGSIFLKFHAAYTNKSLRFSRGKDRAIECVTDTGEVYLRQLYLGSISTKRRPREQAPTFQNWRCSRVACSDQQSFQCPCYVPQFWWVPRDTTA